MDWTVRDKQVAVRAAPGRSDEPMTAPTGSMQTACAGQIGYPLWATWLSRR
jgi:hypothetical protein